MQSLFVYLIITLNSGLASGQSTLMFRMPDMPTCERVLKETKIENYNGNGVITITCAIDK